ncbi:uncharacterized protein C7orf50 homolog [Ceratitis capitata]|uniref:(Mediterranean fruit fly) hypothetical protein n=1 Tax=Ceratitis capitata TaxID=7213 RepID=W8CA76_CERCA|nr:uncharacterized protein C7orf50 homolog [Ceratitis capitata]CAD7004737.1 unnamed protein product [Ceratitis capitata]
MAKKETKLNETDGATQNKPKAKKRKHVSKDNDEEVASKSLIVEAVGDTAGDKNIVKNLKRKHKDKGTVKEKRLKHGDGQDDDEVIDAAEEERQEPTLEEIRESEMPENVNAIITVRQKKKQKHKQRIETLKDQTVNKERYRNEEYLRKWKTARTEWKFEKLRQISIQQTVFDEDKIGAEMWPIALEYLSGSKGAAKAQIIKLAEQCIEELDKQCAEEIDEEEQRAVYDSSKYQRARDLLQAFD